MNAALINNQTVVVVLAGGPSPPAARRAAGSRLMITVNTASNRVIDLVNAAGAPVVGATLTLTLSKDGGAFTSITPTVTERGNGAYNLALTGTHNNTVGSHTLFITATGGAVAQYVYDQVVPADAAALTTLITQRATPAQVNAEVVDALATDTYAEPGQGVPPATASLVARIGYLMKAWRNRSTQTSTEYALYADDGTTKDHKAPVSDDGTVFNKGEVGSGP